MKKISGTYVDNQEYTHTVYYDKSKRLYCKLIHNPEGKYCSSATYTKDQMTNQIEGMTRSFYYLGKIFTPIGNTGLDFFGMYKNLGKEFVMEGYSHASFYNEARKNGCKVVDLYKCEGKTIIPAAGALFEYVG